MQSAMMQAAHLVWIMLMSVAQEATAIDVDAVTTVTRTAPSTCVVTTVCVAIGSGATSSSTPSADVVGGLQKA